MSTRPIYKDLEHIKQRLASTTKPDEAELQSLKIMVLLDIAMSLRDIADKK